MDQGKISMYAIAVGEFAGTLERVREALKDEGFGVITEIDVRATMKQKLGIDYPDYVILGACNPKLAHRALQAESEVGVLLPCNVVVRESPDGVVVQAMDPGAAMSVIGTPAVAEVAVEARERLERVVRRMEHAA